MQVKKEYLDQALINWLKDNNTNKTKSFSIEGHKRLIILCSKLKNGQLPMSSTRDMVRPAT